MFLRVAWLLMALQAAACLRPCKSGTIYLSITLDENARSADSLRIAVAVAGAAPIVSTLAPDALGSEGTVEVDFSAFPSGSDVRIDVAALHNGNPVGGGHTLVHPATGCVAAHLDLGALAYPDVVLSDGPVAYYRLSESSGPSAMNATHGEPGTFYGPVTFGMAGAIAGDPDTAIGLTMPAGFTIPGDVLDVSGTRAFSLEAWAQPTLLDKVDRGIFGLGAVAAGIDSLQLVVNAGYADFRRTAASVRTHQSSPPLPIGAFSHVVATYDGNMIALYVDGAASSTNSTTAFAQAVVPYTVGSLSTKNFDFRGVIDEVALYPFALTSAQVKSHFMAGVGP